MTVGDARICDYLSLNRCLNAYGQDMAASALADWVEFCALHGWSRPWNAVREMMREAGIPVNLVDSRYDDELVIEDGLFDDAEERAKLEGDPSLVLRTDDGYGDSARQMLDVRMRYLGESYPFRFDEYDELVLREEIVVEANAYIKFLRLSILKGWVYPARRKIILPIANLFEQLVAISMRNAGLQAEVIGTSASGAFDAKLTCCADALGLSSNPSAIRHSPYAKDEGVDVIGGYLARDHRIGEPIWLIQASCGKSGNAWESKLMHVDPGKWISYLSCRSMPHAFLSLPYHLSTEVVERFLHHSDVRSFFDRLRLTHMAGVSISITDPCVQKIEQEILAVEREWMQDALG